MKKLFLLALLVLPLALMSCGSDDESSVQFDKNTIVGSWKITEVQGTSEWHWVVNGATLTFNANGTCSTGFSMENAYKIEGGKVKTYYADPQEPMFVYELLNSSGNTLTVRMNGTLDESNLSIVFMMTKE